MRGMVALVLIVVSLWVLERARSGVEISATRVGETPVTVLARPGADGPAVVIAHGFAGSSPMMQGYALPLARAGYRVHSFDFLGHGRHPVPMSGDLAAIDGTTRLLAAQAEKVIDAVGADNVPVALIGHSMATDILVRVAAGRADIGPVVLISAFSREIDATTPRTLLLVTGQWEPGLRDFAREAVQMVDPAAEPGLTATAGPVTRRAVVAPWTEHVSVLQSRAGRRAALDWLDQAYGRSSDAVILPTGHAIIGLVAGLVLLFGGLARRLPVVPVAAVDLGWRRLLAVTALPALAAPPLALALPVAALPVLVADYLALHLGIYAAVQIVLLRVWGVRWGGVSLPAILLLGGASLLIGVALDRYAANFWPTAERAAIILVLALGAVPFFLADARLGHAAGRGRRLLLHGAFLASLGFGVALDFEGLFFLLMIAPVIVLFYLVFGTMGHAASRRSGPLAPGLVLGLVLAWALGVSFPLFSG
ncbi:alpha/beta fold hydrolase [Rhodovulum sp. YNF3179]|uniref:alpha/beta fold hydrolase n=1 Tax=Rhodovulum sp. YNF3179 TaxID=3425127 RepID=UPI003D340123